MLNSICIQGRLTKDPELRYTQTQKPVATFTLACERDFVTAGEQRETDFFSAVAWGKTGEFVSKNFHKGDAMVLCGRLQNRSWEKDGQKHTVAEIVADKVNFCGGKSKPDTKPAFADMGDEDDGELPF